MKKFSLLQLWLPSLWGTGTREASEYVQWYESVDK